MRDPDHNRDRSRDLSNTGIRFALVFGMAYREFVDSSGQSWRVWSTVPSTGSRLTGGFDQGWLTFERIDADRGLPLRRLVPIPPDWETAPDDRLDLMCHSADEVARPRGSQGRTQSAETAPQE
jgi:hypothetical protein